MNPAWISSTVLESISVEADRAYPCETGGVLAGYVADNGEPVILVAIGPGPGADHKSRRFHPDHAWQCDRLDQIFAESSGQTVYLGDWHTHPDASSNISWLDRRTLRAIARHAAAEISRPLMVIGGGSANDWRWSCHRYVSDRFIGLVTDTEVCALRLFTTGHAISPYAYIRL